MSFMRASFPLFSPIRQLRLMAASSGPKVPEYGASPRLNKLAFEFACEAAFALSNARPAAGFGPGSGAGLGLAPVGSDVKTLWSMQKVE